MTTPNYTPEFFDTIRDGSRRSAEVVVPIVLELLKPKSVIDVGCGDGTWLSVFREMGVNDVYGLDGEYVDAKQLRIARDLFRAFTDLSSLLRSPGNLIWRCHWKSLSIFRRHQRRGLSNLSLDWHPLYFSPRRFLFKVGQTI